MFISRWYRAIATNDDGINKSLSSPSSSSSTGDDAEREEMLKYSLLQEEGEEEGGRDQYGDVCLVLQDEDEEESDHSSPMDTWCSDGRLAIVLLNLIMLVRGLLIFTFVFLEGSAAVMNQQDDKNNNIPATPTTTTTFPYKNMFLLMMDLLVVLFVFVVPFVVGLLGAIYYQKHMVLFASLGFLVYVIFDLVFDTSEAWAFFAVARFVCYVCVASIFINALRHNKNRKRIRNFFLPHFTKENDYIHDKDNDNIDLNDNQYIVDNI